MIVTDLVRAAALADGVTLIQPVREALRGLIARRLPQLGSDRAFNGITPRVAAAITARYDDSNRCFAARHLDQPWDTLFPQHATPDRPSPERVLDVSPVQARRLRHMSERIIARARASDWFRRDGTPGGSRRPRPPDQFPPNVYVSAMPPDV